MIKTCSLISSLFLILCSQSVLAQQFEPHDVFVDGTYSSPGVSNVLAADLDNDGDMDVLAAAPRFNNLLWYENLGNKEFGPRKILDDDFASTDYGIGDFDQDGRIDVVAISFSGDKQLVWYRNLGNQNFSEAILITTDFGPTKVEARDIDNDGILDLITSAGSEILFFKGLGNGNWDTEKLIAPDGGRIFFFEDISGDGLEDIVYLSSAMNRLVYRTQSSGVNFSTTIEVDEIGGYRAVVLSDIDNDGDVDIITDRDRGFGSTREIELVWFENKQSAFLEEPIILSIIDRSSDEMIASDFDNDGDIDIVAAKGSDQIAVFENDGNNQFSDELLITSDDSFGAQGGLFFADLDNDTDIDLLSFTSSTPGKISWHENISGKFSAQKNITYDVSDLQDFHFGDLNNDGLLDIVSASGTLNTMGWYQNLGSNQYSQQRPILTNRGDQRAQVAHIVDVDNDGDADIIGGGSPDVLLYKNNGDATFTEVGSIFDMTASASTKILSGDLDQDGDLDLIIYNRFARIHILKNDGEGNFTLNNTLEFGGDFATKDLHLFDLNGDGFEELFYLSADAQSQSLGYFRNDGQGNFTEQVGIMGYSFPPGVGSLNVVDMDNDGLKDLILGTDFGNTLILFINNGDETFTSEEINSFPGSIASFVLGDIDQDGWQDIVSTRGNSIAWYRNQEGQGFEIETYNNEYEQCSDLNLVDLDQDGDLDILATCFFSFTLPGGGTSEYDNLGVMNNNLIACATVVDTTFVEVLIQFNTAHELPDGEIVDAAGIYNTPVLGVDGCVSEVITTELTVCSAPMETIENITLAPGESYTLPGGNSVTTAGTFRVTIEDEQGCTQISTTVITLLTSTEAIISESSISLYPNPNQGIFTLEIKDKLELVNIIRLMDHTGQVIQDWKYISNRNTMDIGNLPPGFYMLDLRDTQNTFLGSKRMVILP